MIFRYGPVKIIFKFQPLEEYSLDLYHFGLMKGILSTAQIADKVTQRLNWLKFNMIESVAFIKAISSIFGQFLDLAGDEIPNMVQLEVKSVTMLLADINNKLLKQVFNFHSTFLEAIFGEENTDNDFTDEEVGKRKVSGPLAPKIKTLM